MYESFAERKTFLWQNIVNCFYHIVTFLSGFLLIFSLLICLHPMLRLLVIYLLLPFATTAQGLYEAVPLSNQPIVLDEGTGRCITRIKVPPNTVRLIYSLVLSDEPIPPDSIGLLGQVSALLPRGLNYLELAYLPQRINTPTSTGSLDIGLYYSRRCVRKFIRKKRNYCVSRVMQRDTEGGVQGIAWQATLFTEKCYLCLRNPRPGSAMSFRQEIVAVVAY